MNTINNIAYFVNRQYDFPPYLRQSLILSCFYWALPVVVHSSYCCFAVKCAVKTLLFPFWLFTLILFFVYFFCQNAPSKWRVFYWAPCNFRCYGCFSCNGIICESLFSIFLLFICSGCFVFCPFCLRFLSFLLSSISLLPTGSYFSACAEK